MFSSKGGRGEKGSKGTAGSNGEKVSGIAKKIVLSVVWRFLNDVPVS